MYEAGVRANRRDAFRHADGVRDARRGRRSPNGMGGTYVPLSSLPLARFDLVPHGVALASRLAIPVLLLLIADAASLIYSAVPSSLPGAAGRPLSLGLLLLPTTFFVIQLTNRRYGAIAAVIQLFVAWSIALVLFPWEPELLGTLHAAGTWALRVVFGFGFSLFVAQFVSVVVFDRLRGPFWWLPPLVASLIGGTIFCLGAYPLAYAGTWQDWSSAMVINWGVAILAAFVLLVPYWLLRRYVEPVPGLGGY
jgi:uncharacterized PurR-regulated membrane protein YhhQ (DUF165 family)